MTIRNMVVNARILFTMPKHVKAYYRDPDIDNYISVIAFNVNGGHLCYSIIQSGVKFKIISFHLDKNLINMKNENSNKTNVVTESTFYKCKNIIHEIEQESTPQKVIKDAGGVRIYSITGKKCLLFKISGGSSRYGMYNNLFKICNDIVDFKELVNL